MKYNECKMFLKKNPYCFRTMDERKMEFDQRVVRHERKPVVFIETQRKY